MLGHVEDTQYSFWAAGYCCSLFFLLKSPEKFAQVHATRQPCTKGTKSAAAWIWRLSVLSHVCDLEKLLGVTASCRTALNRGSDVGLAGSRG